MTNDTQLTKMHAAQLAGVVLITHGNDMATGAVAAQYALGDRAHLLPLFTEMFARNVADKYRSRMMAQALAHRPWWARLLRVQPRVYMGLAPDAPDEVIGTPAHTAWLNSQLVVAALVNHDDDDAVGIIRLAYEEEQREDNHSCARLLHELIERLHELLHID